MCLSLEDSYDEAFNELGSKLINRIAEKINCLKLILQNYPNLPEILLFSHNLHNLHHFTYNFALKHASCLLLQEILMRH